MARSDLTRDEQATVVEALRVYGGEVGKLMKKAEKLNLKAADDIKRKYLSVVALRDTLMASD